MADARPYGWQNYRQNLLVLYEGLSQRDQEIDALVLRTAERNPARKISFEESWTHLNEMELRLFQLLEEKQLDAEIERKLDQARQMKLPSLKSHVKRFEDLKGVHHLDDRRAQAIALLEDMFVRYSYRHSEREKRREVAGRLTIIGLVLLIVPVLLVLLHNLSAGVSNSAVKFLAGVLGLGGGGRPSGPNPLFVVVYFGMVGAYFSRLLSFQSHSGELRWQELDIGYGWRTMSVRLLIGAFGAALLYFLLLGGILSGSVFPESGFSLWAVDEQTKAQMKPLRPSLDFALLIVWSTIAGFSERFVPSYLDKVRAKTESQKAEPDETPLAEKSEPT
jgi:hypothetical protein